MGARADLLSTAAAAAHAAAHAPAHAERSLHLGAAKTALEAAALASDTQPGEIDAALGDLREMLAEVVVGCGPEEILRAAAVELKHFRRQYGLGHAHADASTLLAKTMVTLERDFLAGGTETSTRIAGRIRAALDEAENIVRDAG